MPDSITKEYKKVIFGTRVSLTFAYFAHSRLTGLGIACLSCFRKPTLQCRRPQLVRAIVLIITFLLCFLLSQKKRLSHSKDDSTVLPSPDLESGFADGRHAVSPVSERNEPAKPAGLTGESP